MQNTPKIGSNHVNIYHRYFILGGIIVDTDMVKDFNHKIDDIICKYFIKSELQDDFKLSYHGLRMGKKSRSVVLTRTQGMRSQTMYLNQSANLTAI